MEDPETFLAADHQWVVSPNCWNHLKFEKQCYVISHLFPKTLSESHFAVALGLRVGLSKTFPSTCQGPEEPKHFLRK